MSRDGADSSDRSDSQSLGKGPPARTTPPPLPPNLAERVQSYSRHIVETAPILYCVIDPQGTTLMINPAVTTTTGYRSEDLVGRNWWSVFYPGPERAQVDQLFREFQRTGQVVDYEMTLTARDGSKRVVAWSSFNVFDEAGQLTEVIGMGVDITLRKHAEEVQRRLQAILEATPDYVLSFGLDGRLLYMNWAARELLGLAPEALDDQTVRGAFSVAGLKHFVLPEAIASSVRDGFWSGEVTVPSAGGEVPVSQVLLSHRDARGDVDFLSVIARDIRPLRKAEQSLILHQRAMSATSEGIFITDAGQAESPILYVNSAFERITGYSASRALGRHCCFMCGPDTDPAAVKRLEAAISESTDAHVEMLNYRADGTQFWNSLAITPIRDSQGAVTHFVGVMSDVTQRRMAEEQQRQAQKMEAIGRLAGGLAHDFNNLLTIILGYSEGLQDDVPEGHVLREPLQEIHAAATRAAALTRQLLAFSRRQVMEPQVVDLNRLIRRMHKLLGRLLGEDLDLKLTLVPDLWPVKVDPTQIEQIVMNLAVNARDALPQGGWISIETAKLVLDATYARGRGDVEPGEYVMLSVSDNGVGMDRATLDRIFEPFFTTKEPGQGTGMGMPTVFGIVKQSRGHIHVYSELRRGTTVKIYFPRAEEESQEEVTPPDSDEVLQGRETILLVEDEEVVRRFTLQLLRGFGYRVLEAASPREALRLAELFPAEIQLLLTDVVLPEMSGRMLADCLSLSRPAMKILFVSGYTDNAIERHGVLDEETHFLQKPFSKQGLGRKVREVLDRG